jgi:hypothetical protein
MIHWMKWKGVRLIWTTPTTILSRSGQSFSKQKKIHGLKLANGCRLVGIKQIKLRFDIFIKPLPLQRFKFHLKFKGRWFLLVQ